jgi:chemotaxis protein CheX
MKPNVNFLNPFLEAVREVMQAELNASVQPGVPTVSKSSLTTSDLAVVVGLGGQVRGVVLYEMSEATGLAMVSRVLGQKLTELDDLAKSGVSELGNVITGRASVHLTRAGYDARISVPLLIQGSGVKISTFDFTRLVVPIQTELGPLIVHLSLIEGPRAPVVEVVVPGNVPLLG